MATGACLRLLQRPVVVAVGAAVSLGAVVGVAVARHADGAGGQIQPVAGARHLASAEPTAVPVALVSSPADGATGVRLDRSVTVRPVGGRLTSVRAVGGDKTLVGQLAADGSAWTAEPPLDPFTHYVITATADGDPGVSTTVTTGFTTVQPRYVAEQSISPLDGTTVGVGMPIIVSFDGPVPDKATALRHLQVQMSQPVEGAWHWFGDQEAHYRPAEYWPPGERVSLTDTLAGVDLGDNVWGGHHDGLQFSVGDAHISTVDAVTHIMSVTSNGSMVKNIPVSTGRDKYPTASGIHVTTQMSQVMMMDSATVGIPRNSPDGYYERVYWDVRISDSGEFVHAAPWSVADQGRSNVSHGCINLSTADAQWFYHFTRPGDLVAVTGTPRVLERGNGITDWNLSWSEWTSR